MILRTWEQVTLFSAPNYCGEFDNAGAMMSVDDTLMCSFQARPLLTVLLFIIYFCFYYYAPPFLMSVDDTLMCSFQARPLFCPVVSIICLLL